MYAEKKKPLISDIFPSLENRIDLQCSNIETDSIPGEVELIFVTLPPTIAMNYIPLIIKKGIKVVDLSADYRFKDKNIYEKWYKTEHKDTEGLKKAVYGLPELFNDFIKNSSLVANPGCYPTGTILSLAPLIKNNLIHLDDIIVDSKSGISGAGRKPSNITHYCERNENFEAYKVGCHRHTPEINHILSRISSTNISTIFTPHLIPINRGMLNTVYTKAKKGTTAEDIKLAFEDLYTTKPFIRLKNKMVLPRVIDVANTNFCDISFNLIENRVILISCIDNLIKGASGQAVQNMNIMLGLEETSGLW